MAIFIALVLLFWLTCSVIGWYIKMQDRHNPARIKKALEVAEYHRNNDRDRAASAARREAREIERDMERHC